MLDLIIKPQNKKGQQTLKRVEKRLVSEGIPYEVHYTEGKGDAQRIARELTGRGRCELVVIGGDGSLNDVLTGMCDPSLCRLGLIPAGTGNDFSVSAGIPSGEAALELILKGAPKPTDYIDFSDGRRSLNIAGMGIDVDILLRCERMKGFHDKSKYFFSLLASLMKYDGMQLTVRSGEEVIEKKVLIAALCNGKQFGGGIPMCPSGYRGRAFECGRRRLPQAFQDPGGAFEAHAGQGALAALRAPLHLRGSVRHPRISRRCPVRRRTLSDRGNGGNAQKGRRPHVPRLKRT